MPRYGLIPSKLRYFFNTRQSGTGRHIAAFDGILRHFGTVILIDEDSFCLPRQQLGCAVISRLISALRGKWQAFENRITPVLLRLSKGKKELFRESHMDYALKSSFFAIVPSFKETFCNLDAFHQLVAIMTRIR